ncbi:MAG: Hsp20 family protein [Gammaproteobacteria bacterium]|nr:Hsp20 family protein [Gammaproteobacteria bacterium]
MTGYDFSPLYRSAIGIDRLAHMMENAMRSDSQPSYPPYNIELVDENSYRITMAVAGFGQDELEIEAENDKLTVSGSKSRQDGEPRYLHQGIAARNFQRQFQLADHVKVKGAHLENGLLHIDLEREVPEALKPRRIAIEGSEPTGRVLDDKAA